jgi:mannose-1-phosphate guanylyltransferase
VLAADHVIQNEGEFRAVVSRAQSLAEAGQLVTFGIVATGPETGYGYIRRGAEQSAGYAVAKFVEKPDLERTKGYVASDEYYWNSGIFLFKASHYLEELAKFRPYILEACKEALSETKPDMDFVHIKSKGIEVVVYERC